MTFNKDGSIMTHHEGGPVLWTWWPKRAGSSLCFLGSNIEQSIGHFGEPIYTFFGHDQNDKSNDMMCYIRTIFCIEGRFQRHEIWHQDEWHEADGCPIPPDNDAQDGFTRG